MNAIAKIEVSSSIKVNSFDVQESTAFILVNGVEVYATYEYDFGFEDGVTELRIVLIQDEELNDTTEFFSAAQISAMSDAVFYAASTAIYTCERGEALDAHAESQCSDFVWSY